MHFVKEEIHQTDLERTNEVITLDYDNFIGSLVLCGNKCIEGACKLISWNLMLAWVSINAILPNLNS